MHRTLLRSPWCRQEAILPLRNITSVSVHRRPFLAASPYKHNSRTFSSRPYLASEQPSHPTPTEGRDISSENEPSGSTSHVPWYLQEEMPVSESRISSRDQIPELPEDPPAILSPFLDYVFKDLGLDELKLIDLRGLETPPALGANVIMIIGTARSVKHLNVSADRLCRWLRSNYKLSPYADGLLGRNELKIKLRRKARRARLASRSGAMFDDKDDGITTGWICVNAGVVEESPVLEKDETFEGFGQVGRGTRIVVQIFTEEKRAEVDLESLWQGTLDRAEREKKKYSEVTRNAPPEEVRDSNSIDLPPSDRASGKVPRSTVSLLFEQKRHFHSTRPIGCPSGRDNVNSVARLLASGPPSGRLAHGDVFSAGISTYSLFQYLESLPSETARQELGTGPEDLGSTLFLQLFYNRLSALSAEESAVAQVKLLCMAITRQHLAYSKKGLWTAFMRCTASGYHVSDDLGFDVVSAILTESPPDDRNSGSFLPDSDRELAVRVLEHLSLRGTNVLNMKVLNMLHRATSTASPEVARRISRIIKTLDVPFDPDHSRVLMATLFQNRDYDGFWKLWRKLPLTDSPRTGADYEMLFRLHAELGDELRARDCLSTWVPMMTREETPILLQGQLLQHVKQCLVVADPDIEQSAASGATIFLQQEFDELKPSLFELLAEQQLSDLLPPSIRYILAVATHRHPRYLLRILNSYDEIYAFLSLIVERYYLRNFGGSFTENFYSLKRERVLRTKNGEIPRAQLGAPGPVRETLKLRSSDVWKNLLLMVGIPYLKRKLDEGYDIHAAPQASLIMSGGPRYDPNDDLPPNPTIRQRLLHYYKWFLRNVYPSVNAAYYFSILAFNLAYLFDNTKYSSPFLWLIGTRIRRLGGADHKAIADMLEAKPAAGPGGRGRSRPGSGLLGLLSPQNLYPQLLSSLRYFLPASIFALKFLEWWHASDFSRQLARKATEVLDLPAPVTNGMVLPSERKKLAEEKEKKKQEPDSPTRKSALKSSRKRIQPPISATSYLPIFTVPLPPPDSDAASTCPICLNQLANPTACQTGYVFCYVCVFHWLNGEHQRQIDFMNGEGAGAAWEDESEDEEAKKASGDGQSREGKWESGKGRCPVTGRRVLGGTEGLRRVLI
ncbi:Pex12 amino terminal region-domain-containing protein [Aspergillus pseudonomiae]|uniref:ATPase synthesis protein 25 n=1 Tax=Aspergillus pseudonomiae TaxID=1506151 RepID=A0A5N7D3C6_9EURO|nr:Pex12 amino terminal region-domain-containing protein [Aspergillus pseudonomiae]KAE8400920.1 Pex12 amino terminal region-domain-containing protein [Aspergillus pseudonomiae]